MRKILLLTAVLLLSRLAGHAQPQAYESKTDYQKTQQAAAAIDLPYSTDLVEDAIKGYMAKKGNSGSGQKGFTVYRGGRLDSTDATMNDLYFKVDRRGRDKNSSTVTLLVAKPSEDPATRPLTDSSSYLTMDKAKMFLNNLVPSIEAANLDMQIKGQEKTANKSQKKYNGLQNDQSGLEKKLRNAQADLDRNKQDQVQAAADLQANIYGDSDSKAKAQKKMNKLLDKQSDLEKKIRNLQTDLENNKNEQAAQQTEVQKQQQALDTMKVRRTN